MLTTKHTKIILKKLIVIENLVKFKEEIIFFLRIKRNRVWIRRTPTINSPNLNPNIFSPTKLLSKADEPKKKAKRKNRYGVSIFFKIFINIKNNISFILLS